MTDLWITAPQLQASGLFDPDWYQDRYPDVARTGADPAEHFVQVGQQIGRDPGPGFDSGFYTGRAGDRGGLPPLTHYLRLGWQAGLAPCPGLWPGELARSDAGPGLDLRLGVLGQSLADFTLTLQVWARQADRPLAPTLLHLQAGDRVLARAWARLPPAAPRRDLPAGALVGRLQAHLDETALQAPLTLVTQGGAVFALALPPPLPTPSFATPSPIGPDDRVDGAVEAVTQGGVDGWALAPDRPGAAIDLVLRINGQVFAHARSMIARPDIRDRLGGDGYAGFHFDLPPNLAHRGPLTLEVAPLRGRSAIAQPVAPVRWPGLFVPGPHPRAQDIATPPAAPPATVTATVTHARPALSVIILTRNGAALLEAMLRSALRMADGMAVEWIIIDHQSTDDTAAVCARARAQGLDVQHHPRPGNFSFSQSNNVGLARAQGDIVVFANNDLAFLSPFARRLTRILADPAIGAVGALLTDVLPPGTDLADPVQHVGVYLRPNLQNGHLRAYEARPTADTPVLEDDQLALVPAVTGAFLAMRRTDAQALGGFDEGYNYGLEDIDLCLRVGRDLGLQVVVDHGVRLAHHRAVSRGRDDFHAIRTRDNNRRFGQIWGPALRQAQRRDVLARPGFWTGARPVVAFAVADAGDRTPAGEYYTALELGRALQRVLPLHLRFLSRADWDDLRGVDILIVMVNGFDITRARDLNPAIVCVNWMRQWFDRWADDPTLPAYDHLWAASARAADHIADQTGIRPAVLPIASDIATFDAGAARPDGICDYCFTGNNMGVARDITFCLDPAAIAGRGRVFGFHWEGTPLESLAQGPVDYAQLPDVYAGTRIVIDDANIATRAWGSCNSRLFDAIAAGCLVVTNGALGARELFGDLIPTWHDRASLTAVLNHWLADEPARRARVAALQDILRAQHSYDHRAARVRALLSVPPRLRVAIKTAAPAAERDSWGDFHFAQGLAGALRAHGFVVRVDCREDNEGPLSETDDVCIVLRGLVPHRLRTHQRNILWIISHPDRIAPAELAAYDRVHVAAAPYAQALAALTDRPVGFLPQCTDPDRFVCDPTALAQAGDRVLFVGNSRGVFRDSVRWSVDRNLDIAVYGRGWEPFLPADRVRGGLIPNAILPGFYARSRMVLCDHWADMRTAGFVANRVFDVLAAGGRLVTDPVAGLDDLLADIPGGRAAYDVVRDADDLERLVRAPARPPDPAARAAVAAWVALQHSFAARARVLARDILTLTDRPVPQDLQAGGNHA